MQHAYTPPRYQARMKVLEDATSDYVDPSLKEEMRTQEMEDALRQVSCPGWIKTEWKRRVSPEKPGSSGQNQALSGIILHANLWNQPAIAHSARTHYSPCPPFPDFGPNTPHQVMARGVSTGRRTSFSASLAPDDQQVKMWAQEMLSRQDDLQADVTGLGAPVPPTPPPAPPAATDAYNLDQVDSYLENIARDRGAIEEMEKREQMMTASPVEPQMSPGSGAISVEDVSRQCEDK